MTIQNTIMMKIREWNEVKSRLVSLEGKMDELIKLIAGEQKEQLTPAEVCERLKITRRTYYRYVKAGKIEQLKQENGKVYVIRSDLEKRIDEGRL